MNDIRPLRPRHQAPVQRSNYLDSYVSRIKQEGVVRQPVVEKPVPGVQSTANTRHSPEIARRLRKLGVWLLPSNRKHPMIARAAWGGLAALMFATILTQIFDMRQTALSYILSPKAEALISQPSPMLASSLKLDAKTEAYQFNEGYQAPPTGAVQTVGPKFSATFAMNQEKAVSVVDPVSRTTVTFKPQFDLAAPKQNQNRLVYPIKGRDAQKIYTLASIGLKEDIILNKFQGDELDFAYKLELSAGTEARLDQNGALAIYGVSNALLGNVSTGSEQDAKLLQKARESGKKDNLLFTFPAPFIREFGKKAGISDAKTWFTYKNNELTVHASHLSKAAYPLSIDPSIYIETAAKLMQGNNESNIDFDISNELIQKSQTTGARIDAWQGTQDMSTATWNHATAAAGGYVYRVGGTTGVAKPQIVDQQQTLDGSNGTTFTMSMPATRPAGDLYVALICHDGAGTNVMGAPSGWTEYADLGEHAAYYKIGTDQGGGNEASTYQWSGPSEEYAGVIVRVTGFNSSDVVSGTAGTGSSGSNTTPVFPATTPDNDASLVIRAVGADTDAPSATGWVPTGHTKIDSQNSSGGGNGSCGFTAASLDAPPLSGVSTGTATLADTSINDSYGASTLAINPAPVTPTAQSSVYWAKFNSSTLAIETPSNPGAGVCSGWCTDSAYNLPEARLGFSLVAYNGFMYAMGGTDGAGTRKSTVYIAKLGANGEPSLWHPTDTNKNNWVYWYTDTGLNGATARSYLAAFASNNRMYILGGQTNAATGGTTTVEYADIKPTGQLGTWTSGTALPSARHSHSVQVYNDAIYLIGGNSSGTLQNSVYYNKINSNGSLNAWTSTTSFTTARSTFGGSFTAVWGGYLYIGGGCTGLTSGFCNTVASDMQLASINADGTLSEWNSILNLQNQRIGYTFIAWQGGLYRLGGCVQQNTSTGACIATLADVDYGVINQDGDASTVATSVASGVAPCTGGSPVSCNLPGSATVGNVLTASAILNGYLYIMGGCNIDDCSTVSSGVVYQSIASDGSLSKPASCGTWTAVDSYCTNSTSLPNALGAAGTAVFNGRIYVVGGFPSITNISYAAPNSDGSISSWTNTDTTTIGATDVSYTFAYARANPASAGTNPGNLYLFGGCTSNGTVSCTTMTQTVYKCNIGTSGAPAGCSTTNQLQIGTIPGANGTGLGAHAGAVYANYIYLIGGLAPNASDLSTLRYAKFDNNNNVVTVGSGWVESASTTSVGRRRGAAFGYNGYIYVVGGYDASAGVLADIEFAKVDVSTGDVGAFAVSAVSINQRWGLSVPVSNSYAYVIGGCTAGDAPTGCTTRTDTIQTFQMYNNDSGAVRSFIAGNTLGVDRIGGSSTIMNGYIYYAGGCTAVNCSTLTATTYYAAIDAYGVVGTWSSGGALPTALAWGKLVNAGGTLYYVGGQTTSATTSAVGTIYYSSSISSGNPTWNGSAATRGIGDTGSGAQARTQLGASVWNNRIYVTGGFNASAAAQTTVYGSPSLSAGGNISSNWTSTTGFSVARGGHTTVAYANNLYVLGGFDGTNYLNDVQYTQINGDGTVDGWTYTTSLSSAIRDAEGFAANGYMYLVGGRTATTTCLPNTIIAPISANTTIASGNNPTGVGEWYETNVRYAGDRYGAAASYYQGRFYLVGGGCSSFVGSGDRMYYTTVKSQPQIAKYSRLIDTDTDVFPNSWLMNGLDNSTGAEWYARYRSSTASAAAWGQETNYGKVTLGDIAPYVPRDSGGTNTSFARYYYFSVNIDSSQAFGYPEDVSRGPTVTDLSLFFTADPAKRLMHGKTFTGGVQQPLDTPCRQSVDADCPLP